jgi:DNA-directed RNA polymerase specialized sigma24 family protein
MPTSAALPSVPRQRSDPESGNHTKNIARPASRPQRAELFDRRRHQGRELADALVARADYLLPEDRALIKAIYRDGATAMEIAQLTGVCPRSVRRRIRILAQRALDPRFTFVLFHREGWPATRRKVATELTLHGRPLREAARHLNLTLHAVRRHADAIRVMYEALGK